MRYISLDLRISAGSPYRKGKCFSPFYGYLVTTFASSRGPVLTEPIRLNLNRTSFRCNDGRCVQKAGTYSPCDDDTRILGAPCSRGRFQTSIPTANRFGVPLLLSESLLIVLSIVMRV